MIGNGPGNPGHMADDNGHDLLAPSLQQPDNGAVSPRHIAIIADGNGRWARARNLPINRGHDAGALTLKARLRDAIELGVEQLTVYAFSTENWSRRTEEVEGLFSVLARRTASETPDLHGEGVRMRFIGRRDGLGRELQQQMRLAEELTVANERLTLFVALNYGGRAEILDAARGFQGTTEEQFRACLYAPEMHDPELVIRTGGEQRLSNFMLWQSAYAELIFREELWPDFGRESFVNCLSEFRSRIRRFGRRELDIEASYLSR